MGTVASLVMWPGLFEQIFIPPPLPMETPYEIWLQSALWFLRRRCLKSVDDRQTTEAYISYKLTNEPSAQVS